MLGKESDQFCRYQENNNGHYSNVAKTKRFYIHMCGSSLSSDYMYSNDSPFLCRGGREGESSAAIRRNLYLRHYLECRVSPFSLFLIFCYQDLLILVHLSFIFDLYICKLYFIKDRFDSQFLFHGTHFLHIFICVKKNLIIVSIDS